MPVLFPVTTTFDPSGLTATDWAESPAFRDAVRPLWMAGRTERSAWSRLAAGAVHWSPRHCRRPNASNTSTHHEQQLVPGWGVNSRGLGPPGPQVPAL